MNFEILKRNNKKKIILGSMIVLSVVACATLVTTRAKYKNIQNIKLANGTVDYKAPDLKLAIKVSEDGVNYTSRSEIPTSGYTFNTDKSKCRIPTSTLVGENASEAEEVTIEYTDGKINVLGVTKKDTRCYVYFDKVQGQTPSSIIADIKARTDGSYKGSTIPSFTSTATGTEKEDNNGIFETDDPMYGENAKTYYWRGAATTNHVIFDNKCWRIIRINGDKSIRLIYNGETQSGNTCKGNGSWDGNTVLKGTAYNTISDGSKYVGWTYSNSNLQRPSNTSPQTSGTASRLKIALESWYNDNITNKSKIVKGNFCNDRNIENNEEWQITGSIQYYATYNRLSEGTKTPRLSCPDGDVYSLYVGIITADEVQFAGASWTTNNTSYYLYNGQYYWTMSPYQWDNGARVFILDNSGFLDSRGVSSNARLRPVINLRSDVTFNAGSDGTQNNPYIVQ